MKPYKPIAKSKKPDHGPAREVTCKRCGKTHTCVNHFGPCDCGKETVGYASRMFRVGHTTHDGWKHSRMRCSPPPPGSKPCSCGYATLRPGHSEWSKASYSSGEDPRARLVHTLTRCFDEVD